MSSIIRLIGSHSSFRSLRLSSVFPWSNLTRGIFSTFACASFRRGFNLGAILAAVATTSITVAKLVDLFRTVFAHVLHRSLWRTRYGDSYQAVRPAR